MWEVYWDGDVLFGLLIYYVQIVTLYSRVECDVEFLDGFYIFDIGGQSDF